MAVLTPADQGIKSSRRDEAIRRLASGYAEEFAEFCAGDEDMHHLMQVLADRFVEQQIPITDEDAASDLAYELFIRVTCTAV